jgi:hypothetical protein
MKNATMSKCNGKTRRGGSMYPYTIPVAVPVSTNLVPTNGYFPRPPPGPLPPPLPTPDPESIGTFIYVDAKNGSKLELEVDEVTQLKKEIEDPDHLDKQIKAISVNIELHKAEIRKLNIQMIDWNDAIEKIKVNKKFISNFINCRTYFDSDFNTNIPDFALDALFNQVWFQAKHDLKHLIRHLKWIISCWPKDSPSWIRNSAHDEISDIVTDHDRSVRGGRELDKYKIISQIVNAYNNSPPSLSRNITTNPRLHTPSLSRNITTNPRLHTPPHTIKPSKSDQKANHKRSITDILFR